MEGWGETSSAGKKCATGTKCLDKNLRVHFNVTSVPLVIVAAAANGLCV